MYTSISLCLNDSSSIPQARMLVYSTISVNGFRLHSCHTMKSLCDPLEAVVWFLSPSPCSTVVFGSNLRRD